MPSKLNAELQANTIKIKADEGAVYFNDDTSLLAVATTGHYIQPMPFLVI